MNEQWFVNMRLQWMGNSAQKQTLKMPVSGCRILQILNPELESKLQPFTDYIIEPSSQQLRNCTGQVHALIFSTLDYSLRNETLPISQTHLGARMKFTTITDCSLKVTKVFPHSPCERVGITADEYIVGLLEAQFNNLSTFAEALRSLISSLITTRNEVFTLAICNQLGVTRLVPVSITMLKEWRCESQGILGCELAEGWMHRFKARPRRSSTHDNIPPVINKKEEIQAQIKREERGISGMGELEGQSGSEQWDEIQRKVGGQAVGESIQVHFKGLLKNQYLQDSSTICRCKIYDKSCEKCYVQRDGGMHFFNKKTNRIVTIPSALLLQLSQ